MHVHSIALPSRYLQVPHDILRHPRLNGTAKSLLMYALSLPPGSRETLQTIGAKMFEGRGALTTARKQLIDAGYVHVRHQQSDRGLWSTTVMVSNVALRTPEEIAKAWGDGAAEGDGAAGGDGAAEGDGVAVTPSDQHPTVGARESRAVGGSPEGEKIGGNTPLPGAGTTGAAAAVLQRSLAAEPRLRIGVLDTLTLAPLVAQWLERGITEPELQLALVEGLPSRVMSAAALVRNRLVRKMPPPPASPPEPAAPATRQERRQRPERHECGRCADPVPAPGICRGCARLRGAGRGGRVTAGARVRHRRDPRRRRRPRRPDLGPRGRSVVVALERSRVDRPEPEGHGIAEVVLTNIAVARAVGTG